MEQHSNYEKLFVDHNLSDLLKRWEYPAKIKHMMGVLVLKRPGVDAFSSKGVGIPSLIYKMPIHRSHLTSIGLVYDLIQRMQECPSFRTQSQ